MASEHKAFNPGLAWLKFVMCFGVVFVHFRALGSATAINPIIAAYSGCIVPIFMFVSFFLTHNRFDRDKASWFRQRLWRLWWPLPGWALLYFLCLSPLYLWSGNCPSFLTFLLQAIFGHCDSINPSMWFQFDILVITMLFILLFRLPRRVALTVLVFLLPAAFMMQYSGLNLMLFGNMPFAISFPMGRLCEMIPYAVAGYCAGQIIPHRLSRRILAVIFTLSAIVVICQLCRVSIRFHEPAGFNFSGINRFIETIFWFLCFWSGGQLLSYSNPRFDRGSGSIRFGFTKRVTDYILGIYCCHRLVAAYFIIFLRQTDLQLLCLHRNSITPLLCRSSGALPPCREAFPRCVFHD